WPVYQLDLDRVAARRDANRRNATFRGDRLSVFAPNLGTDWNAGLRPPRVAGRWQDVKAVRADTGIKGDWAERFRESRERDRRTAAEWLRERGGSDAVAAERKKLLEDNRRRGEVAQNEFSARREQWRRERRGTQPE